MVKGISHNRSYLEQPCDKVQLHFSKKKKKGGEGCGKIVFSILESFPVATRQVTGWKKV